MSKRLTDKDFCKAAKKLRCGVANIKAVAEVESLQNGFLRDGKPVILFERHKFYRYSKGKWSGKYPDISNRSAGGYGKAGQHQWDRFNKAFRLDPVAAMLSCSWGKFQVMGFNYAVAGYRDIHEFVDAMKVSEAEHLNAFVNFVIANGIADELRQGKWAAFAYRYNGSGYKKNRYDVKMANAFRKYSREDIDCEALLTEQIPAFDPNVIESPETAQPPATKPVGPTPEPEQPDESPQSPQVGQEVDGMFEGYLDKAEQAGDALDKVQPTIDKLGKVSQSSLWTTATSKLGGWAVVAIGLFEDKLPILIIGAVIVIAVLLWWHFSKSRATERIVALKGTGDGQAPL